MEAAKKEGFCGKRDAQANVRLWLIQRKKVFRNGRGGGVLTPKHRRGRGRKWEVTRAQRTGMTRKKGSNGLNIEIKGQLKGRNGNGAGPGEIFI